MREEIYSIVKRAENGERLSRLYDMLISVVAVLSIVPLMFKTSNLFLDKLDVVTVYILFMDYIFRWITHDFASGKKAPLAFIIYPFTPFAIIDFISLLPSLGLLHHSLRILRMLRIFKVLHYSKSFVYISNVFTKQKRVLGSVLIIALAYIFVSALAMFSYEPDTFDSFFDALYWATTALTTVGYGDVYPLTSVGQLISMVSSLFGIAVIALPAGIITGGFLEEIDLAKVQKAESEKNAAVERAELLEAAAGGKSHE